MTSNAAENGHHPRHILGWILIAAGVVLLCVTAGLYLVAQQPLPVRVQDIQGEATVELQTDNARLLLETDCFDVRWAVEGIQSVRFNGSPKVGTGTASVCGGDTILSVKFRDDRTIDYRLSPHVTLGSGFIWQFPMTGVICLIIGVLRLRRPPQVRREAAILVTETTPLYLWATVTLIVVGTALRAPLLSMPIRGDEAWTVVDFASRPLAEAISVYTSTNNHLLHTLLQHLSIQVWGDALIWLRLPALFAGILTIAAGYRAGTDLHGRWVGLIMAATMALHVLMVEMSLNARAYSLWYLLLLLMLIVGRRALRHDRRRAWLILAGLTALSLYATPLTIYSVGAVLLWILLNVLALYTGQVRWRRLRLLCVSCVVAGVLTLILYLPVIGWFVSSWQQSAALTTIAPATGLVQYAADFGDNARQLLNNLTKDVAGVAALLLQIGTVVGLLVYRWVSREPISPALCLVLWLVPLLYSSRGIVIERAFVFLLPMLALTAGAGLNFLVENATARPAWRNYLRGATLCVTILGLWIGLSQSDWQHDSYDVVPGGQHLAAYLIDNHETFDIAVMRHPVYNVVRFYLPRMNPELAAQILPRLNYTASGEEPTRALLLVNRVDESISTLINNGYVHKREGNEPVLLAGLPDAEVWGLHMRPDLDHE